MIYPFLVGNISCVTLFDEQYLEDFIEPILDEPDRKEFKEPISTHDEKIFMSLGVYDGSGVPGIFEIGMPSIVSLGVPG